MVRPYAWLVAGGVAAALAVAGPVAPVCAEEPQNVQTVTVEVVDPAAYLKEGRHGPEHVDETYEAVDGGQTLALLDLAGETLYVLLAERPGDDPNALVYDYVNQQVKATGQVYTRGGIRGMVVTSVEPLEAAEAPTPAPDAP